MVDQASKLRELVKSSNNSVQKAFNARTIAVTSGKGGVGKSNVTTNLGIRLAQLGKKVTLLDADLGMANIDVLLGLAPKNNLYEVLQGDKSIDEVVLSGPAGVKFIPGGSGFHETAYVSTLKKEHIEDSLMSFTEEQDYLFIDTGAGMSQNTLAFISAADEVIVVVTPEPTSLADAYGLIKALLRFNLNDNIYLIVNMAESSNEARMTADRIITVVRHFLHREIELLGFIFKDDCVIRSVKKQLPFVIQYPKSIASRQIEAVAQTLITGKKQYRKQPDEGFVRKLMRFFT